MTLNEWIKKKIMKFLGLDKLPENPNNDRLLFVNDTENIKAEQVLANKIWYLGNGDDLLSLYTGENVSGFNNNPIYNTPANIWCDSARVLISILRTLASRSAALALWIRYRFNASSFCHILVSLLSIF